MSARNAWFIHVQRIAPLASPTTAWKILKPRRRVTARLALLISPSTAALLPGPQRGDRLHAAAVLVAERKPVEQIFDRDEAGALEVGGLARADALQELERAWRGSHLGVRDARAHCLLNDDGLALADIDLPDARRQRERIVEADALGMLGACASSS